MLVTLKEILNWTERHRCAVGSFNTPNLESIMAVVNAAEECKVPVIIQHAQIHERFMPISVIGQIMLDMAEKADIPVCVHLDHGETLEYIGKALEMGFTSVMYDGSALPYEENVQNTQQAVYMARRTGASVEAEIGSMGKRETGIQKVGDPEEDLSKIYTDPNQAKEFAEKTGIDALACSFGTSHGIYLKKPVLDMTVLDRIRDNVDIPLVMHGGSGVSELDYRMAISKGIRKVNYYTYMAKAGGSKVVSEINLRYRKEPVLFHDISSWGMHAMKEDAKYAIRLFAVGETGKIC